VEEKKAGILATIDTKTKVLALITLVAEALFLGSLSTLPSQHTIYALITCATILIISIIGIINIELAEIKNKKLNIGLDNLQIENIANAISDKIQLYGINNLSGINEDSITLSEEICKNAKISDDEIELIDQKLYYVENTVQSDTMYIILTGLSSDYRDFVDYISRCNRKSVVVSLFGFGLNDPRKISLSIPTHCGIFQEFIKKMIKKNKLTPKVIIVGFSSGSNIALWSLTKHKLYDLQEIKGFIFLDGDISRETLYVTEKFSKIKLTDYKNNLIKIVKEVSESPATIEQWISMNEFLVRLFNKFKEDITILPKIFAGILKEFPEDNSSDEFVRLYRKITENLVASKFVFTESYLKETMIKKLIKSHFDSGSLGNKHEENMIKVEKGLGHYDLIHHKRLSLYLDEIEQKIH